MKDNDEEAALPPPKPRRVGLAEEKEEEQVVQTLQDVSLGAQQGDEASCPREKKHTKKKKKKKKKKHRKESQDHDAQQYTQKATCTTAFIQNEANCYEPPANASTTNDAVPIAVTKKVAPTQAALSNPKESKRSSSKSTSTTATNAMEPPPLSPPQPPRPVTQKVASHTSTVTTSRETKRSSSKKKKSSNSSLEASHALEPPTTPNKIKKKKRADSITSHTSTSSHLESPISPTKPLSVTALEPPIMAPPLSSPYSPKATMEPPHLAMTKHPTNAVTVVLAGRLKHQRVTMPIPEPGEKGLIIPGKETKNQGIKDQAMEPQPIETSAPWSHLSTVPEDDTPLSHNNPKYGWIGARLRAVARGVVGRTPMDIDSAEQETATRDIPELTEEGVDAESSFRPGAYAMQGPAPVFVMADEAEEHFDDDRFLDHHDEHLHHEPLPLADMPILDADVELAVQPPTDEQESNESRKALIAKFLKIAICVIIAAAVLGVVLATVLGRDGGDEISDAEPVEPDTPTETPTRGCYKSTKSIATVLRGRSADTSSPMDIVLCNNTATGFIVDDSIDRNDVYWANNPVLFAQSNVNIRCGDDGSLLNECIIHDGETMLQNTEYPDMGPAANNVTFEGITFQNGKSSFMELINGGDITFKNCLFRLTVGSQIPIIIDYVGREERGLSQIRQTITFDNCIFEDMKFSRPRLNSVASQKDVPALILATNPFNSVVIKESIFRGITLSGPSPAGIIASAGASVRVEGSCFYNNDIGQNDPVFLFGNATIDTFAEGQGNYIQGGDGCLLAEMGSTSCVVTADADSCQAKWHEYANFDFLKLGQAS